MLQVQRRLTCVSTGRAYVDLSLRRWSSSLRPCTCLVFHSLRPEAGRAGTRRAGAHVTAPQSSASRHHGSRRLAAMAESQHQSPLGLPLQERQSRSWCLHVREFTAWYRGVEIIGGGVVHTNEASLGGAGTQSAGDATNALVHHAASKWPWRLCGEDDGRSPGFFFSAWPCSPSASRVLGPPSERHDHSDREAEVFGLPIQYTAHGGTCVTYLIAYDAC